MFLVLKMVYKYTAALEVLFLFLVIVILKKMSNCVNEAILQIIFLPR